MLDSVNANFICGSVNIMKESDMFFAQKKPQTEKHMHDMLVRNVSFCVLLSWFYALCSQIIIPLPFSLVPVSIQPFPLLACAWFFGLPAIYAYALYLAQGVLGAPFFAKGGCGLVHLLGPTGGYLVGFGMAMLFLHAVKKYMVPKSIAIKSLFLLATAGIYFSCGLAYLSCFVPVPVLFSAGLYPFLLGDSLKLCTLLLMMSASRFK